LNENEKEVEDNCEEAERNEKAELRRKSMD
jgi:hypothetical protein